MAASLRLDCLHLSHQGNQSATNAEGLLRDHLANNYSRQGRIEDALRLREQTLELWKLTSGPDHLLTLIAMHNLANSFAAVGRHADALKLDEHTTSLLKAKYGDDHPKSLGSMVTLAVRLANCPDASLRDPARAIQLANKLIAQTPNDAGYWWTLGIAHYRAGNWKATVTALEKSMELAQKGDASDWFILAMAHWQLGKKDQARTFYAQAMQWMEKNETKDELLHRLHTEADDLLHEKSGGASPK